MPTCAASVDLVLIGNRSQIAGSLGGSWDEGEMDCA